MAAPYIEARRGKPRSFRSTTKPSVLGIGHESETVSTCCGETQVNRVTFNSEFTKI
jgi:hypothetical protein